MTTPAHAAPRAVLWDLDGTLADSSEFHWRSWLEALEPEGVHITRDDFLASFGQRNDTILPVWLGADADAERIRRVADAKEEAYRRIVAEEGLDPLPGAAEWVRALHDAGWRQAIASSAPRENVRVMHRALRFEGLIETLVGAEDVHRGKPDPEVFLAAAAHLGVEPERCVVVEDAPAGIEAARRGGMKSIGVGSGDVGTADVVVGSLADLPDDTFGALLNRNLDS
jgi:HAD superfamily hydrolase (TIGR01509 family)